jgi:hypothetical protein
LAAFFIALSIPRDWIRLGFVQIPLVITWLIIPLGLLVALAACFRNFRSGGVWVAMLAAGLFAGLLIPIGFDPREGAVLAAIRFSVVPWTLPLDHSMIIPPLSPSGFSKRRF